MTQVESRKGGKQVVVELTMTLEEAKKTIWRAGEPQKPIIDLLKSGEKTIRDIAWASKYAYDQPTLEACRTILAHLLGEPVSLRFGLEVIEGSRYLEENEREYLMEYSTWFGAAIGVGVMFVLIEMVWGIPDLVQRWFQGQYVIVICASLIAISWTAGISWFLFKRIRKSLDTYRSFRSGREGEERIVDILRSSLDSRWTIFRNLHLPGHKDDLDLVLLGPGGVWAVETKAWKGTLRVDGINWEFQEKRKWKSFPKNPSNQAKKNAAGLRNYLQRQGINIGWVECAVALGEFQPIENFTSSEIPIWLLPTIEEQASKLTTRKPPTGKEIEQINTLLQDLATKQLAKEEADK